MLYANLTIKTIDTSNSMQQKDGMRLYVSTCFIASRQPNNSNQTTLKSIQESC